VRGIATTRTIDELIVRVPDRQVAAVLVDDE